jgi:hypothetical protein
MESTSCLVKLPVMCRSRPMSSSAGATIDEDIGDINVKMDIRAAIAHRLCRLRERGSAGPLLSMQGGSADDSFTAGILELEFGAGMIAKSRSKWKRTLEKGTCLVHEQRWDLYANFACDDPRAGQMLQRTVRHYGTFSLVELTNKVGSWNARRPSRIERRVICAESCMIIREEVIASRSFAVIASRLRVMVSSHWPTSE